jgi:hypothetical protein
MLYVIPNLIIHDLIYAKSIQCEAPHCVILCILPLPYVLSLNTVTDLLKAFLGNGSVNTFQHTMMEDVSQWTNVDYKSKFNALDTKNQKNK